MAERIVRKYFKLLNEGMDFRDGWIGVESEQFSEKVEDWKK